MLPTERYAAVIPVDDPSPIAFINVFEKGDVWVKTRECAQCGGCCGNDCAMLLDNKCRLHMERRNDGTAKPFHCIIAPKPHTCKTYCTLEFTCIAGTNVGKVIRVRDREKNIA